MFGINAFVAGFDPSNSDQLDPATLIEVNAFLSEDHGFDALMTDHPVESGGKAHNNVGKFHDNIVLLPPVLNITGIFTDTPMSLWNPFTGITKSEEGLSQDKGKKLIEMREKKELFSINTTLGFYTNYFFSRLNFPITPEDGYSLRFTATLKNINIVTAAYGDKGGALEKSVAKKAAPKKVVGTTTTKTQSIAAAFLEYAGIF